MLLKVLRRTKPQAVASFFLERPSLSYQKFCSLGSSRIITRRSNALSRFTTDAAAVSSLVIQSSGALPNSVFDEQTETSTPVTDSIDEQKEPSNEDGNYYGFGAVGSAKYENLAKDIKNVFWCLKDQGSGLVGAERRLERCTVRLSPTLVEAVLYQFKEERSMFGPSSWSAALAFFHWAGCQPGYEHSSREYESMIAILARNRLFDAAWTLVEEMSGRTPARIGRCLVRSRALLILARWYSAAGEPAKAIATFQAMEDFGISHGVTEFQSLLGSLCRYGHPADAELMLIRCGRKYIFRTRTFNIVLRGWCDAPLPSVADAKRFWKVMESHWVPPNAASYAAMISCMSRTGESDTALALFSEMKAKTSPDRCIYHDVIRLLSRVNRIKEAVSIFKSMEAEAGLPPSAETYNALFGLDVPKKYARGLFDKMSHHPQKPIRSPSELSTSYSKLPVHAELLHAFFQRLTSGDDVMEVLDLMKQSCCMPRRVGTYMLLIRKLCELQEHEKVLELWNQMCNSGPQPDRLAYTHLVHGSFCNGWLDDARKFYLEMKTTDNFVIDPRVELGLLVKRHMRLVGKRRASPRYISGNQR